MRVVPICLFLGMLAGWAACSSGATQCAGGQTACGNTCVAGGTACGSGTDGGSADAGVSSDASTGATTLTALTLSAGTLSPVFTPYTATYTVNLPIWEAGVAVTPTATDPRAILRVNGAQVPSGATSAALTLGSAPLMINVVVQGTGGALQTYAIVVMRGPLTYVKASNTGQGDQFGTSVALTADTLAVGAPLESSSATGINGNQADNSAPSSGAVYVFRLTSGTWKQEAYLKASNTGASDQFGTSLALSGDTLAVAAKGEDSSATNVNGDQTNNSATDSGAVYVFRRTGTVWQQEAYIKASNTQAGDGFGSSVALADDTLAVGATGEDSSATGANGNQNNDNILNSGAVYVYKRIGTFWQLEAYLKASNTGSNDNFGESLALSGDTLAVGASNEDSSATGINGDQSSDTATDSGAVYVFKRTGAAWQQEAYLKASNAQAGDRFGISGSLSVDTLAVGAYRESSAATGVDGNQADNNAAGSGAVYVFQRTGTTWMQQTYLKASNTQTGDQFGISVALSVDTLAVGADQEDSSATGIGGDQTSNTAAGSGAVYVFKRLGTTWSARSYVKATNTGINDGFGTRVALSGDSLAAASPFESSIATGIGGDQASDSTSQSGAVYLF